MPRFRYLFVVVAGALLAVGAACHRGPRGGVEGGHHGGVESGARGAATPPRIPTADSIAETVAARGTHIALLYGSNLRGEYEHCGCPSHPLGGLARRATVIDGARAEADGVLVVDAGDDLSPSIPRSQASNATGSAPRSQRQAQAEAEMERRMSLMLSAMGRMGVSAFLPGERDLAIGVDRLRRGLARFHVPAVASNLFPRGLPGGPLFAPDRLIEIAGIPVGVFGVVSPAVADRATWEGLSIELREPVAVAREEVASLRARGARMIVALVHFASGDSVRDLLEAVPGIDWAVQGHTEMQLESVDRVGGARRVEAFSLGKLVGRLDIHVVDGGLHVHRPGRSRRARDLARGSSPPAGRPRETGPRRPHRSAARLPGDAADRHRGRHRARGVAPPRAAHVRERELVRESLDPAR